MLQSRFSSSKGRRKRKPEQAPCHKLLPNFFQMFHPKLFWRAPVLFTEYFEESYLIGEPGIEHDFINRLFSRQQ